MPSGIKKLFNLRIFWAPWENILHIRMNQIYLFCYNRPLNSFIPLYVSLPANFFWQRRTVAILLPRLQVYGRCRRAMAWSLGRGGFILYHIPRMCRPVYASDEWHVNGWLNRPKRHDWDGERFGGKTAIVLPPFRLWRHSVAITPHW